MEGQIIFILYAIMVLYVFQCIYLFFEAKSCIQFRKELFLTKTEYTRLLNEHLAKSSEHEIIRAEYQKARDHFFAKSKELERKDAERIIMHQIGIDDLKPTKKPKKRKAKR